MIKFLKFLLSQVTKFIDPLNISLIELVLIVENNITVGLIENKPEIIKNKPTVCLLLGRVLFRILLNVSGIGLLLCDWLTYQVVEERHC